MVMSQTVWKFSLSTTRTSWIAIPGEHSKPLHVGIQDNQLYLWALCDPSRPMTTYQVTLCGTGHELPDNAGDYVGTFQTDVSGFEFVGLVFIRNLGK